MQLDRDGHANGCRWSKVAVCFETFAIPPHPPASPRVSAEILHDTEGWECCHGVPVAHGKRMFRDRAFEDHFHKVITAIFLRRTAKLSLAGLVACVHPLHRRRSD